MIFLVIRFNQILGFRRTQNHTLRTCSMKVSLLFEVRSRAYLQYFCETKFDFEPYENDTENYILVMCNLSIEVLCRGRSI